MIRAKDPWKLFLSLNKKIKKVFASLNLTILTL